MHMNEYVLHEAAFRRQKSFNSNSFNVFERAIVNDTK